MLIAGFYERLKIWSKGKFLSMGTLMFQIQDIARSCAAFCLGLD